MINQIVVEFTQNNKNLSENEEKKIYLNEKDKKKRAKKKKETKKRGQRDRFNLVKVWHTIMLNREEIKSMKDTPYFGFLKTRK